MEFPNEHNSQRNDKRAERANAGKPDNQPAVRSLPCGLLRCFHSGFLCGFAGAGSCRGCGLCLDT
mgnify:FL=1